MKKNIITLFIVTHALNAWSLDFKQEMNKTASGAAYFKKGGHAYCQMKNQIQDGQTKNSIQGYNVDRLVPMASVSKLFTSYWALKTLGPQFRFENHVYLFQLEPDRYDVHIAGSLDPSLSRQTIYLLLSDLQKLGVKNIRHLTFDENLRVFLNVLERSSKEDWQTGYNNWVSSDETKNNLEVLFNSNRWPKKTFIKYAELKKSLANIGVELNAKIDIKTDSVDFLTSQDWSIQFQELMAKNPTKIKKYIQKSSPLYSYLKKMNITSNNYIADTLWHRLGGASEFKKFISKDLQLTQNEIEFYSGSGLPDKTEGRKDNLASCKSVLKLVNSLYEFMHDQKMQITDVMMVSGVDIGTLGGLNYSSETQDALVAKTGTLNQAKTLAGLVSAENGEYFFGIFFKLHAPSDVGIAVNRRDHLVKKLISENGGRKDLGTHNVVFLTVDQQSTLVPVELRQP